MAGDVIGRESELATLHRFLDSMPTGPSALLLSGEPGIGKTTVWKEGLAGALDRGHRTLSCSPVEAETRLSYTVLGDLVESVLDESLPTLPEPQRAALEVALLRSPRTGGRADQRAVSLAVLGCIRAVASAAPVVVAIDDAQWMDLPSARVLQFVVRRLRDEPIGVMTAVRRSDGDVDPLAVGPAFPEERVHDLHVGPLSLDDIERVILETVGERFPRTTLLRIHEMSGGNPFFAQEIALSLLRGDEAGERLPIPDRLQELIEHRLEGLPGETVEALEVVSALSLPKLETVAAADRSVADRGSPGSRDRERGRIDRGRPGRIHPPAPRVCRLPENPVRSATGTPCAARIDPQRSGGTSAPPGPVGRGPRHRRRRCARESRPAGRIPRSPAVGSRALGDGAPSHAARQR